MPREFKTNRYWAELYEDALEKLVVDKLASYSVGGQQFTKQNISFYQEQYEYYKAAAVADESGGNGISVVNMGNC